MIALSTIAISILAIIRYASSKVEIITDRNFEEIVGKNKSVLVKHYAPWCGHCKVLEPEFASVGDAFESSDEVIIAKIDCDEEKERCIKNGIKSYPTLQWYARGSLSAETFSAPRNAEAIVEEVNRRANTRNKTKPSQSAVVRLNTSTFGSVVFQPEKDAFVFFGAPWCGHCKSLSPVFEDLAVAFKGEASVVVVKVDATEETDLAERYHLSGFPTLLWYGRSNKEPEAYNGKRDLQSLISFVNERAGTSRNEKGEIGPEEGRIKLLDHLIQQKKFDKNVLSEMEKEAEKLEGRESEFGDMYLRAARKVLDNGPSYLSREIERLESLLKNSSVNLFKKTMFMQRRNVLKFLLESIDFEGTNTA